MDDLSSNQWRLVQHEGAHIWWTMWNLLGEMWWSVVTSMKFTEAGWHAAWNRRLGHDGCFGTKFNETWLHGDFWVSFSCWSMKKKRLLVSSFVHAENINSPRAATTRLSWRRVIHIYHPLKKKTHWRRISKISIWSFFLESIWSFVIFFGFYSPRRSITCCHGTDHLSCPTLSLKCHVRERLTTLLTYPTKKITWVTFRT